MVARLEDGGGSCGGERLKGTRPAESGNVGTSGCVSLCSSHLRVTFQGDIEKLEIRSLLTLNMSFRERMVLVVKFSATLMEWDPSDAYRN